MPVLDVVVNPSGALSGARTVRRGLDEIGRSAAGMERTLGGAVGRLKGMLAGLVAAVGLKNLAKGFLDAAVNVENYQMSLQGVIKDAEETKRVFEDINKWAALNPVDTDDAIRGFVLLKSAAVKNTKEAVEAAADLATVMQVQISDVASAVVSLNTIQLRRLGILLDQSGKKAIIQSGNVRKEVEKDVDSIRAGLIELIQENFGGMMRYAGDTWSAALKTMGGQWNFLQQSIMGSVGSGGPFDKLKEIVIDVRDRWNAWMVTQDYQDFVRSIQGALIPAIEGLRQAMGIVGGSIKALYDNAQVLKLGLLGLAGYKGIGAATAAFVSFQTHLVAGLAMLPNATSLVSKLGKAFTMFSVTPGYINAIRNAIIALGLTPGGMVLTAVAGLLAIAVAMDDTFEKARKGLVNFNKELKNLDTEKLREMAALRDSSGGFGLGGSGWKAGVEVSKRDSQEAIDALNRQSKAWRELSLARSDARDAAKLELLKPKPKVEDPNKGKVTASGPSAAERLVSSIRDKMQYLYADGKSFLPVLDQWAAKLKPLSEDWKKIVDLQRDIRSDESTRAADDAIAAMERLAEKERQQTEALEAARAGVQKFWSEMSWANQQGLVTDENYFDMLSQSFDSLKAKLAADSGGFLDLSKWENWTEEMKSTFAAMQSLASKEAGRSLDALRMQLDIGNIGLEQYREGLAKIREQFSMFPGAVQLVGDAMRALDNSILTSTKTLGSFINEAQTALRDKLIELPDKISGAFASAIVYGENLGDTLKRLAQDIAAAAIKAILLQSIFGKGGFLSFLGFADGAAFQGGQVIPFAKGGVVTKPTIFPMARGMGLMGEAGPEAVMPLKRGSDGKLGVEGGGGTTHITVNINAIEPQSFAQAMRSNKAVVESVVVENIMRNGAVRSAIRGAV